MKYFHVCNLKELLKMMLFTITLLILLFLAKSNFSSVHTSINLFINNIFPSLFPFIFFTEIILNTNIIDTISKYLGKLIYIIFKLPKESCSTIVIGFLCGYPMGSKTVSKLYEQEKITKDVAKKLLTFVNNCNPVFIISTIGYSIFNNVHIGYILLISHILSALIIALFSTRFNFISSIIHKRDAFLNSFNKKNKLYNNNVINFNDKIVTKDNSFFETLKKSIFNTFKTLILICGFVIIFNLFFSILEFYLIKFDIDKNIIAFISGLFEVTKGCLNVSVLNINPILKICLISFLLGFSGFCILSQVYSTISMHNFSFKLLMISKIFQGLISSISTYIILHIYGVSNISSEVFLNTEPNVSKDIFLENIKIAYINSTFLIIFALCIYMIISICCSSKYSSKKTNKFKKK